MISPILRRKESTMSNFSFPGMSRAICETGRMAKLGTLLAGLGVSRAIVVGPCRAVL